MNLFSVPLRLKMTLAFSIWVPICNAQLLPWHQAATEWDQITNPIATNTIVAVIDTGFDLKNRDLNISLWTNPGETGFDKEGRNKQNNGIDDDNNGFVDDVHGWNFANRNSDLQDEHGHGTHSSALIAANSPQFRGYAPGTKIMVLKYFDSKAPIGGNLMNSVRAIKYALSMGAHIINYSGGGLDPHPMEKKALELAEKKGVLVVAAAGNESTNADLIGFYPASYNLSNILSVMAIGPDGQRFPSSNWGPKTVQISAPGEHILSAYLKNQMAYMSGTSQATALVTGAAVLLREKRLDLTAPQDLIQTLIESGRFNAHLTGQMRQPQMLSIRRALLMENSFAEEFETALSTYSPNSRLN